MNRIQDSKLDRRPATQAGLRPAAIEKVHVIGTAPFVAVITDGRDVLSRFDVVSWRYLSSRIALGAVMPDGGIVEQSFAIEHGDSLSTTLVASDAGFEGVISRGLHRYDGCRLIVARPSALSPSFLAASMGAIGAAGAEVSSGLADESAS